MKNIVLVTLTICTLVLIGCGGDTEPKKCECENKAHLEAGQTCDCGGEGCNCTVKPEQPKAQSATLTNLFNNDLTATVEGYFTDTEWNTDIANNKTIADDIQTALETAFNNSIPPVKNGVFGFAFKDNDVVIIAEKNPGYDYKVDNNKKIRLNINALSTINFEEAITALRDYQ